MNGEDKRNNDVHYRLVEWGAYARAGKKDGPRVSPCSASWQHQVTGRVNPVDIEEPQYIDADNAERTHAAIVRMMQADKEGATLLMRRYRDGFNINVESEVAEFRKKIQKKKNQLDRGINISRNKFWKFL